MAGEKLIDLMNKMSGPKGTDLTDFVLGEVTALSPLTIKVDSRFYITEKFIKLSKMVQELSITVPEHGTIQVWTGLQVGDKVRMLRLSAGQLFYVIEKEV